MGLTPVVFLIPSFAFASYVSVSSPVNGAQVGTSFKLVASSSSCSGQPVSAMGYSLDNSSNTTIIHGNSINTTVSASTGSHVLHVKSWGNAGAGCVANVDISVSASPPPSSGVSVSSPANGAQVGTSFKLVASSSSCSGQPVSAMGYSLDNSSNTTIIHSNSIDTTVSASTGSHVLHVKSWGNAGAGCVSSVSINVTNASAPPPASSVDGITVKAPAQNAYVAVSFPIEASATLCSGQTVSAMGFSFDGSSSTTIIHAQSINQTASVSPGIHVLHVKSWGNKGAGCVANVDITAGGAPSPSPTPTPTPTPTQTSGGSGPSIPANAIAVSNIQQRTNWKWNDDPGTSGSASGTTGLVSSPERSGAGQSRECSMSYSNGGGEIFYDSFGSDVNATHFVYDTYVYLPAVSHLANLEMDMNQVIGNGQTVIYGFQCDGYSQTWDYTENANTPSQPKDKWLHSSQFCNPRTWAVNTWHHVQIEYSRNSSGVVTYQTVWLDGKAQSINKTVPSAFALGWGKVLLTNFQLDGLGSSGSNKAYVSRMTVFRW